MNEGVGSGKQAARRVVHVDLNVQGARIQVDGIRVAQDRPGELLIGKGIESHFDRFPIVDVCGVNLRDGNVDTQLPDRGQVENFFRRGIVSGLNQGAYIGIARGNDSIERRRNSFECLQLLQPVDIRVVRVDECSFCIEIADCLVGLLL
jgi:hypothetical protein